MKISRLRFIGISAAFTAFLLALLNFPFRFAASRSSGAEESEKLPARRLKMKQGADTVSILKCETYNPFEVYGAIRKGLGDIGFKIRSGSSVLLKPNILAQNTPDQCTTTHPAVVEAVCRIFSDHKCRITIGESSAFYQGGGTRKGFVTSGIGAVAERYGAELLPFEATRLRKITGGNALDPFYITEAVFSYDLVVNLPKMKVHQLAGLSGAIKNLYGCIPGGTKQLYHKLFQERPDYREYWGIPLVDVFEAVKPGLNIMDAVYGLDNNGPAANGDPKYTGLLLVAENAAALDLVACRIMDLDYKRIPAVREAVARGLANPEKIKTPGDVPSVPYVNLMDEEPSTGISRAIGDYMFDRFIVEPRIDMGKCSKCGTCINDCAVSAINIDEKGYPVINLERCIRCYCCSEYCKVGAIGLHGGAINHIIRGIRSIIKL